MVQHMRESIPPSGDSPFPHMNDESGWEYYCFPKGKENEDCSKLTCRKPCLSELVHMDYVCYGEWSQL